MTIELVLFLTLALVAVASGLGMLFSRSAVYSALFLILNFVTVAIFYIILNAGFIAFVQIAVYAGAIMVLFLFVIMLLGAEQLRKSSTMWWQQPLAIILGVILLAEAVYLLFSQRDVLAAFSEVPRAFGSPTAIGKLLFSSYLLPFEVTSVLLLVAIIGAIVLTRNDKK
jgi:NADH-quinone oxidoreductase subunit J